MNLFLILGAFTYNVVYVLLLILGTFYFKSSVHFIFTFWHFFQPRVNIILVLGAFYCWYWARFTFDFWYVLCLMCGCLYFTCWLCFTLNIKIHFIVNFCFILLVLDIFNVRVGYIVSLVVGEFWTGIHFIFNVLVHFIFNLG